MSPWKISTTILASLAFAAFVWASEADELREKAGAMQREAAQLAERGHREEAENLERKALAMLEEAEQLQHRRRDHRTAEISERQERLELLRLEARELAENAGNKERLADIRHEAERLERELHELVHGEHRQPGGPHEEVDRRLEHMRIAVEHLQHAGLHDVAKHVAERAEATERTLHEQHRHREGDPLHAIMKQLDELRHEVGRLRDQVNELTERR
jgi:hypothetical protein